jgi:NTE family protein
LLLRRQSHHAGIARGTPAISHGHDLPGHPRWIINGTTFETGKNWIFSKKRMGDYVVGYVLAPKQPVAEAIAASAGFPGGIGPLAINVADYNWSRYEGRGTEPSPFTNKHRRLTIWDGGVYDNLGLEPLWKPQNGLRDGADFLIVSDASKGLEFQKYRLRRTAFRLLYIAQDQVRSVRARELFRYFSANRSSGAYLRIGNSYGEICDLAKKTPLIDTSLCLSASDANSVGAFSTTLRRLNDAEFDRILCHGYEVADATLSSYCEEDFRAIPFGGS